MHFASAWLEDIKPKQKMHLWDVLSWSLELPSAHPPSPACFIHCETGKIQFKDMPCTKGIYVAIELAVYGSFILKSRNEKKKFKYCSICRMKPTTLKAKKSKKKKGAFCCIVWQFLRQWHLRPVHFFSYSTGAHTAEGVHVCAMRYYELRRPTLGCTEGG